MDKYSWAGYCYTGLLFVSLSMDKQQVNSDIIVFGGVNFIRYPDAPRKSDRRYYKGRWRINGKLVKTYLHRVMWIDVNGPIPESYHIHHKDGNYLNNELDNFECISAAQHLADHYAEKSDEFKARKTHHLITVAQEAAKGWHKSDEGRAWHKAKAIAANEGRRRTIICEACGCSAETRCVGNARFCSPKCKQTFCNRLPENVERRRLYAARMRAEKLLA